MSTIVTRAGKGSALTWTEGDANITNLNNDKLEAGPAANAALSGFTTTATAAGVTILTNTSSVYQLFTGTTTHTVRLPSTATLATGWSFHIVNNSTGNLSLHTSSAAPFFTILPGTTVMATCISTADNFSASWEAGLTDFSTYTGSGAVVLGTSPTLTTPVIGAASGTSLALSNITLAANGNVTVLGVLDLGNASDTTLQRTAAGVVAIEGVEVVTLSRAQTLTNKTLTSPTLTTPALGTPSAIVLTNASGTASININGTVGATAPSTGVFTTLSASTSVSMSPSGAITLNPTTAGTINNMSIGATTAATGRFTTVQSTIATGTAPFTVASTTNVANLNASSLNGATFAAPGSIGSTTAGSGAFSTLSATGTTTLATSLTGLLKAASGVVSAATAGTDYVAVSGALGTPSSGTLTNCTADGTNSVGFRSIPSAGAEKTASYTLATSDRAEFVQVGSGGSITVPNSTFAAGDVVVVYNNHTAAITITLSTTNAYIAGTNTNKTSVSLATRGVCNILFISSTVAILTGNVS